MSAAENNIRADLEAAVKQHAEPADTEVVETEVAPVAETKTTEERARDDKGRFAAKEAAAAVSAKSGDAANGVAATSGADAGVQQPAVQPAAAADAASSVATAGSALAPPNGWTAEAKAKWHELPPEIMAAVQKREQDIAKFTSTRDEHASFGKEMYQAVTPYLATIKAEGGTPRTAVESMLNTAYLLRTGSPEQKRELILRTAQQFGVDLGVAAAAKPNGQPQNTEFASLQNEIATLKNELAQFKNAGHQQLQSEVQTEIEAFAADPKHAHYESVKGHMAALIGQGLAKDLQDAYDQAVWARPDTRATLAAQQRADEEQKRRAEAKRKAEEAKRKNVSITGGPGNTAGAAAPGGRSIRDELMAAVAASDGAV